MDWKYIVITILIVVMIFVLWRGPISQTGGWATSPGVLTQLYSQGPMD